MSPFSLMVYNQHFFLHGQYIGLGRRHHEFGQGNLPRGYGLYCPECSELWFNAPVEGRYSTVELAVCDRHKDLNFTVLGRDTLWSVPGCVWIPYRADSHEVLSVLPPALVNREFEILLTALGKDLI